MTKSVRNITIDTDTLQILKAQGVNISGICNEFLKNYAYKDKTPAGKNLEEAKQKFLDAETESSKARQELAILETAAEKEREESKHRIIIR